MGTRIPNYDGIVSSLGRELLSWLESLAFALVVTGYLFIFLVNLVEVDGGSMEPTLYGGDRLVVQVTGYSPKIGDIVVLQQPKDKFLVKRIIAVGGQTVNIDFDTGVVYRDGVALDEPYVKEPTYRQEDLDFPVVVPEGHVFVMGDNRNHSTDSRDSSVGMVKEEKLTGKVFFRLMPFESFGFVSGFSS